MNKNEKDFMNQLSNLNDFSVEEIAENYPALDKKTKKRILKKCMKKDGSSAGICHDGEEEFTISGTERYRRSIWYKYAASAAAFVIAAVGIASIIMLNRNFDVNINDYNDFEVDMPPAVRIYDSKAGSKSEEDADTTNNTPISLSGTNWFKYEDDGPTEKEIEFDNDGVSGYYIIYPEDVITTESTKIPFTYEQNGYDITFCIGPDDTVTAKLGVADWRAMMTLEWQDGHKEYFYNHDILTTSSDNDNGNGGFGYWGTNDNKTSQKTPTGTETSVNNSNNSVSPTNISSTPAQNNPPEPQKSFLNGLYYAEISGVSGYCDESQITRGVYGYMGFEFMPDGTLTKYFFDETGNAIGSTIVKTNYEIVENQFSYGNKSGTIVNSNDSTSFTVQFDDGDVINFSTKQPTFRKYYFIGTKPDTLNGTIWAKCFGDMDENYNYTDRRTIEFKEDGISGTVYILSHPRDVTKSVIIEIPFTYEQNGDEITFYMESSPYAMVKAEISCTPYDKEYGLDVEYLEADEWGNNLWCFGQTGCLNDYHYNY